MNIESAKKLRDEDGNEIEGGIGAIIDGNYLSIPTDLTNRHYAAIIQATAYDGSFWGDTVPESIATEAAEWLFAKQLSDYRVAIARLAQYVVADGRAEVTDMQSTGEQTFNEETGEMEDVMMEVVTVSAIDPVEATVEQTTYDEEGNATTTIIENPLITQDNAEREAAQAVVNTTPQAVKDSA